ATKRIKRELRLPSVVITFTSFHQPEIAQEAKRAGAAYHVRKPFTLDELRLTLLKAAVRGA
ncbi:MAG TPA: sigma-54-dependent Fis family transcriptional regulator, partial [Limnochordia bacterium]|nr:sigma-54-dependent Fis family transcriptional regulator [Limnochordia bacterium]